MDDKAVPQRTGQSHAPKALLWERLHDRFRRSSRLDEHRDRDLIGSLLRGHSDELRQRNGWAQPSMKAVGLGGVPLAPSHTHHANEPDGDDSPVRTDLRYFPGNAHQAPPFHWRGAIETVMLFTGSSPNQMYRSSATLPVQ
jgi:hypothetical protein